MSKEKTQDKAVVKLSKGQVWMSAKNPDRTAVVVQIDTKDDETKAQLLTPMGVKTDKWFTIEDMVKSGYKLVRTLNDKELKEALNENKETKEKEEKVMKKENKPKAEGPVSQYNHRAGSNAGLIDEVLAKVKKGDTSLTIEAIMKETKLTKEQVVGYLGHLRGKDHNVHTFDFLTARPKAEKPAKAEKKVEKKAEAKVEKKAEKPAAKVEAKAEKKAKK